MLDDCVHHFQLFFSIFSTYVIILLYITVITALLGEVGPVASAYFCPQTIFRLRKLTCSVSPCHRLDDQRLQHKLRTRSSRQRGGVPHGETSVLLSYWHVHTHSHPLSSHFPSHHCSSDRRPKCFVCLMSQQSECS